MSVQMAELVLQARTESLKRAQDDLDRLRASGAKADQGVGKAMGGVNKSFDKVGAAAKGMAAAATAAFGALAAGASLGSAISQQLAFGSALAETSTLLDGNARQMAVVEQASRDLAQTYGGTATAQAQAFYQAISAGASSAAEAATLLDTANQLAIGGVTDVTTAVDILTTSLDTFGHTGITVTEISDTLFTAMKGGKTTVGELSASLGKALPFASKLGLSFEETAAATAALTRGGISTAESVTGLRAAFTAILAPGDAAKKLAADLGLEFNESALKTQNFAEFMADVVQKTGGGAEALQTLFGSVEAMNAALALSGPAGDIFNEILDSMAEKAGATSAAFRLMADDDAKRLDAALSKINDVMLSVGSAALTALVPAVEAAASIFVAVADNADALAIAIGTLALTQIPAMIGALSTAVIWLGTMEAALIVGVVQAKALAFAMNAIPFVAVVTGVTMLYRAYGESKEAAEGFARALDDLTASQDALSAATTNYYNNVNQANLDAMKTAAEQAVETTRAALEAAQRELEAASFTTNFFGASLYETERMAQAKAAMAEIAAQLVEAEARLSAAENAQANFNARVQEGGDAVSAVVTEADKLLDSLNGQIAMQQAIAQYGKESAQVAELQAAADRAGFEEKLKSVQASEAMKDELREAFAALQAATSAAASASTNISGAAGEAARLAQNLTAAANALSAVMSATANMNVSAIGLEAQNKALEKGNSLIQARTEGLIAAKRAELDSAFGSEDAIIRKQAEAQLESYTDAVRRNSEAQAANEKLVKAATASVGGAGGASKATAKELKLLNREIERLEFDADPVAKYTAEVAKLDELLANGLSEGAYQKALQDLNEELRTQNPLINDLSGAWKDFVVGGLRDFDSFVDKVKSSFANMLYDMIFMAKTNKVMVNIGASGGGTLGTAAQAATGAPGGGGMLGGLGGIGSAIGGIGSALTGGFGLATQGLMTGGLGGMFSAIGGQLGIATTSATAFAGAVGAVAAPLLAVAAAFSFFRKKTTELNSGLRLTTDGLDSMIQQFKVIETSRFWGLSKKISTSLEDVEAAISDPMTKAIAQVQASVIAQTEALGISASVYDDYTRQIDISTKGLSEEEAAQEVQRAFDEIAYSMANIVVSSTGLVDTYENSAAILEKLSTSLTNANAVMDDFRLTMFDVSLAGGVAAASFVDLFGGMQAFNEVATFFYQNFYSDSERLTNAASDLFRELGNLGVAIPSTRDQFRALVDAADAAGDRELVASLMQLAPLFVQVTEANAALNGQILDTEAAQTALTSAFGAYEQAVGREISRLRADANTALEPLVTAISVAQTAADDASQSLDGAMSSLRSFVAAQISAAEDAAAAIIDPLQEQIEDFATDAGDAADRLDAAFDQVQSNIEGQVEAIQTAAALAIGVLEEELAGLEEAATNSAATMQAAFETLEQAVSSDIAAIESGLNTAIELLNATAQDARVMADEAQSAVEAIYRAVINGLEGQEAQVTASYAAQIDTATAAITAATDASSGFVDALRDIESALASRRIDSAASDLLAYRNAQEQIRAFAGGTSYTADQLSGALSGVSQPSQQFFGNRFDYELDFAKTTADLRALRDQAEGQISEGQQQITLLEQQVTMLEEMRDAEVAAIAQQRAEADALYNATIASLNGQQVGNASLSALQAASVEALSAAQAAATAEQDAAFEIINLRADAKQQISELQAILEANRISGAAAIGTEAAVSALNEAVEANTVAQDALNARQTDIKTEIKSLSNTAKEQVAALNTQLERAQAEYDVAMGIEAGITDVEVSIEAMRTAADEYGSAQSTYLKILAMNTDEIEAVERARDAQIRALEAQLETAQALYDTATGQAATLTSIDAHMVEFNAALAEYTAAQITLSDVIAVNQPLIDDINDALDAQVTALTDQLEAFRDQVAPVNDLPDAILALQNAIGALAAAQNGTSISDLMRDQLDAVYQRTLGRAADDQGAAYWADQILGGMSLADVERNLTTQPEYKASVFAPQLDQMYQAVLGRGVDAAGVDHWWQDWLNGQSMSAIQQSLSQTPEALGIPSYAAGTNSHPGGLAMVGERGAELVNLPRGSGVSTAGETRRMLDNSELIAELRAMREENRALQQQLVRYARKTAEVQDQWNEDGLPAERTA